MYFIQIQERRGEVDKYKYLPNVIYYIVVGLIELKKKGSHTRQVVPAESVHVWRSTFERCLECSADGVVDIGARAVAGALIVRPGGFCLSVSLSFSLFLSAQINRVDIHVNNTPKADRPSSHDFLPASNIDFFLHVYRAGFFVNLDRDGTFISHYGLAPLKSCL